VHIKRDSFKEMGCSKEGEQISEGQTSEVSAQLIS